MFQLCQVIQYMLQMFHLDVLKVDLGGAHVAMGYTCMFQVFHLSSHVYCKCFIWMFQKYILMFAHVAMGYTCMFQMHVLSVLSVFRHMLQMFHLNISKVDIVLHILQWCRWLASTFSLFANSLTSVTALSWSPATSTYGVLGRCSQGRWRRWCGKQWGHGRGSEGSASIRMGDVEGQRGHEHTDGRRRGVMGSHVHVDACEMSSRHRRPDADVHSEV
jgi:hypothetical protein